MDPIALIMTALVSGATASLQETATQAVKDAYAGLKVLIQKKFSGNPKASVILAEHEKDPKTWQAPMEQAIKETGLDQNEEILQLAQELIQVVKASQPGGSKYNIKMENVQGVVQGDNAAVTMNFSDSPARKRKKK